jgi:hypothetical protein
MVINRARTFELMDASFNGNYNRFAKELKVDPSHLHRFLKKGVGGGRKLTGALIKFCKDHGLDFEKYVDIA